MEYLTKRFGEIEYSKDLVIRFTRGIIGFENCEQFLFMQYPSYEPFKWLTSIDQKGIRFPLINPFFIVPEFGKELSKHLVERLFSSDELIDIFCVANLRGKNKQITLNLKSPIIIDFQNQTGEQIILSSEELMVAYPIC